MVPYQQERNEPPLTRYEKQSNKSLSIRRMPVEHANAIVKNHKILSGFYRGSYEVVQCSYKVIVHTTAYMLRNSDRGAQLRIHALRPGDDDDSDSGSDWDPPSDWGSGSDSDSDSSMSDG